MPAGHALRRPAPRAAIVALVVLAIAAAGCGGAAHADRARAAPGPTRCDALRAGALGRIAHRIYAQAATGRNVASAVRRLARSRRLAAAVERGDPKATRTALAGLLKHQIHRIVIARGPQVLATYGHAPALAPVHGELRDAHGRPVGRYVMTVSGDSAVAGIMRNLMGVHVVVHARGKVAYATPRRSPRRLPQGGTLRYRGTTYRVLTVRGTAFPAGPLRLALLVPRRGTRDCASTPSAVFADTVGAVGRRLFATESRGAAVRRVLRHVARDRRFDRAVADDDPAALRAAIVRFFRTRTLHVVRIRATGAHGRLVGDVGGPDALAPASRTLRRSGGRVLGRVTLSVQDDTGYIKLMHRFTGAQVLLRTPAGQIAGSTLSPGPAAVAARGRVRYRGRSYEATSFAARAFPAGPLRISLLTPAQPAA